MAPYASPTKALKAWSLMLMVTAVSLGAFLGRLDAAPKAEAQMDVQAPSAVNINTATAEELEAIRGIGPAIAERIIQYRSEHGPFAHAEDLTNIRGIGEAKFQKIKEQVTI